LYSQREGKQIFHFLVSHTSYIATSIYHTELRFVYKPQRLTTVIPTIDAMMRVWRSCLLPRFRCCLEPKDDHSLLCPRHKTTCTKPQTERTSRSVDSISY